MYKINKYLISIWKLDLKIMHHFHIDPLTDFLLRIIIIPNIVIILINLVCLKSINGFKYYLCKY